MVKVTDTICPKCKGKLKYVGPVKRIVRTKGGKKDWVKIRRMFCTKCGMVHRELPDYIFPYKHYEAQIIKGVINGTITSYDLEYEDYPSEMTMKRWRRTQK